MYDEWITSCSKSFIANNSVSIQPKAIFGRTEEFCKPLLHLLCLVTPHFASAIVNKGFILLSHFCTRSRTGHVYHNNKQQQSTKTDLDTSWDLLKTLWSTKWQVGSSTVWFSNFFELSILTIILKRVWVIAIYVLSTLCTVCHQQLRHGISREPKPLNCEGNKKVLANYSWQTCLNNL